MAKIKQEVSKVSARTQTGPFALPLTGKLTILNANAKNPTTKGGKRFGLYRNGTSVQGYIDASVKAGNRPALAKADLMWDFNHEFVACSGTTLKPLGAPARGRVAPVVVAKAKKAKAEKAPAATV